LNNRSRTLVTSYSWENSYNEGNICAVKDAWEKEKEKPAAKVFTMVQSNAPCDVTITKASRKACVKALLG